ncbi:MAG TPA: response regulator [Gemmataceae bacterium]|jgi:carbon storage regulator CsrA|nr:response regulator [Gemmataceae bacterium]
MLVLSRRPNEKVLFPSINTSVQVVTIKPGVVRLGIQAPPEVAVFREEILDRSRLPAPIGSPLVENAGSTLRELNHMVRNRLNAATVGLALLRRQLKAGLTVASEGTLERINEEFRTLQHQVEEAAKKAVPPAPARARKAHKALLVEDDTNERELLAGFLRLAGLDVATAGDGTDALDYLRGQGRPDVVLLDMVLPRCDGPTTVREIRRDPALAGLKIFAVTGHAPERFGLEGKGAGIDRWFNKPLNPENLLRDLQQELGVA